jgi:Cu2+-exporting ATPase
VTTQERCFHCGEPVPAKTNFSLVVNGTRHRLCCPGCLAVATLIERQGLARFYDFRTLPSLRPKDGAANQWDVCDRPEVAARLAPRAGDGRSELRCRVDGVTCAACVWLLERGVRAIEGVTDVGVNPLSGETSVHFDPQRTRVSAILHAIASFGFEPRPALLRSADRKHSDAQRTELKRLAVAGLGSAQVMTLAAALYVGAFEHMDAAYASFFVLASMLIATPVVLYSGAPIFASAWRDLRHGRLGMDVPVALALVIALAASLVNALRGAGQVYFDSATMFLFFLVLGRSLESRARRRAGGVFDALADLRPLSAARRRGGTVECVGTIELAAGDVVVVAPGEPVPADGEIVSEQGAFDESLLSGESLGRLRTCGDSVLGGSVNVGRAPVDIRVTRLGADSYLERVGGLLQRALADRPAFLRVADQWATWFVVALLAITALAAAFWLATDPARTFDVVLALLVVTCPCALSLAAPAAFAVALGTLARRGLLLSSARVLERLGDVTTWMFDKTGTLTEARIAVGHVATLGAVDAQSCLALAAALEAGNEHPIARALRAAGPVATATGLDYRPGYGVTGTVEGRRYRLGSARHVGAAAGDDSPCVYLADEQGLLARIELTDTLRPYARDALAALAARGYALLLVSGDSAGAVHRAADALGVTEWHAARLPEDKLKLLEARQMAGAVVAAVGDGINDAPLLAQADVSVALVAGSKLAQASADVVFTGEDLRVLARLPEWAAATRRIVRQNLAWAAVYNLAAVPLAAAGVLAPWMAAIGMSLSSIVVVGNALRLTRLLVDDGPAPTALIAPRAREQAA